jgi:hypothetical protein
MVSRARHGIPASRAHRALKRRTKTHKDTGQLSLSRYPVKHSKIH